MIKYFEDEKTFMLNTNVSTYSFKINDEGYPVHLFYGAKPYHILKKPMQESILNGAANICLSHQLWQGLKMACVI